MYVSEEKQNDQEPITEGIDMVDPALYANDNAFTPSLSRVRPYYKSDSGFARASFFSFFHVDLREQWDMELFFRGIDRSSHADALIKRLVDNINQYSVLPIVDHGNIYFTDNHRVHYRDMGTEGSLLQRNEESLKKCEDIQILVDDTNDTVKALSHEYNISTFITCVGHQKKSPTDFFPKYVTVITLAQINCKAVVIKSAFDGLYGPHTLTGKRFKKYIELF